MLAMLHLFDQKNTVKTDAKLQTNIIFCLSLHLKKLIIIFWNIKAVLMLKSY